MSRRFPSALPGRCRPAARSAVGAVLAALLAAGPASALVPLPPCEGVEADMWVGEIGDLSPNSGMTLESYSDPYELDTASGVYKLRSRSAAALHGFHGVRVTDCASGRFLTVASVEVSDARAGMVATEFLRADAQAERRLSFANVSKAAEALYDNVKTFRETDETCACAALYPQLRPAKLRAFGERTDVEF